MKKNYVALKKVHVMVWLFCISAIPALKAQVTTQTLNYTGAIVNFTVPLLCVPQLTITAKGASGGNNGGLGASMRGVIAVTPRPGLKILVCGAGGSSGANPA